MAKNPKIELPLRNDFGILCDPKIVPNTNLDTVCFTLPLKSLAGAADYPLCRFKKWHRLGYRCAVFEKNWVFAYEVFDDGIIIRDMCHTAILKE